MKDFALNQITHDTDFINQDIPFVEGIDEVVQNLKTRLWVFEGEWFLDTARGLPYFDKILVKTPNIVLIETLIRNLITNTDSVINISYFNLTFDKSSRKIEINFKCDTTYGETPLITETLL